MFGLAQGVIILKGTEIGDNCVIGAGTVLQGKIPNNSLVKYGRDITVKAIDWE
ncbi:MAG: DapH/DapD/GlmU-related protein [Eisenbergiella massiliensis]